MSATSGLLADVVRSSVVDGPGHRYVVFVQGCTFNCLACHNPHTIPRHSTATTGWCPVDELVDDVASVAPYLSGVTVSGGEPTTQWQFVRDLFEALDTDPRTAHLTRLVDSNGDAEPFVWDELGPWMHGAMVDLKALDPEVHLLLTRRGNERVLASIAQLQRMGKLTEVRLLIVPGVNDTPEQLAATGRWLARLDPLVRVVVQGFRHAGTRPVVRQWREARPADLDAVVAALAAEGVAAVVRAGAATEEEMVR
jgi:pyruvate formate lyase activating enzyme